MMSAPSQLLAGPLQGRPLPARNRPARRGATLLATASLVALLADMPGAAAEDCAGTATPPSDLATPSMLYDMMRPHTDAKVLALGFLRKPVDETCAWIYEVKVLTASGSVVELDFAAADLDLIGARGPTNDRDAAALVKNFGGDSTILATDAKRSSNGSSGGASGSSKGSGSGGDDGGGDDGGEGGGEGGNSGSGSGGSGSGGSGSGGSGSGGSGSGGSGSGGGSGEGGEGGSGGGGSGHGGSGGSGGGDD